MNEVDELRRAMRVTERADRTGLDLAGIMREGRRVRRRRRVAGTGAVAVAVAAVVIGGGAVARIHPPEPPAPGPVATAPVVDPTTGGPGPTATADSGPVEPRPRPVGAVVGTGIRYGDDERVFYVVPVDVPELPGVTIGLAAGRRSPTGGLTTDYLVNDVAGSDRRPGFHEIGYDPQGRVPSVTPVPTFGYFVGPAARIVGTVDGRHVEARLARWSEDPQLVIFWFDPGVLTPATPLDGIVARDARGGRL
ncbi:hypothetical protein ACFFMM_30780 [Micromonospora chaiyaphumensis]|uniref:Uncharacterized protein n=1 Tax=Micromonospora chaiyaphumensis TaxID=307119 RepID=A0A1C4X2Y8_9ACTN|nr:hypothetical protein [Micromonospora chaiyaphumensis]SCF02799.1 hypothetical protein GA0070214_10557 [Micromonospora chaiyaphumensis]